VGGRGRTGAQASVFLLPWVGWSGCRGRVRRVRRGWGTWGENGVGGNGMGAASRGVGRCRLRDSGESILGPTGLALGGGKNLRRFLQISSKKFVGWLGEAGCRICCGPWRMDQRGGRGAGRFRRRDVARPFASAARARHGPPTGLGVLQAGGWAGPDGGSDLRQGDLGRLRAGRGGGSPGRCSADRR